MQHYPCSVKRTGATWGISDDVYVYTSIVFSAGMLIMFEYVVSLRANHGDKCDFATNYTYAIYIGKLFLLVRTYRADMLHDIIHSYCIKKQTLKTKINLRN
jgi:hypothetical protein